MREFKVNKLRNLRVLLLNYYFIKKIKNLDNLINLEQWLLSNNFISKIEDLINLTNLKIPILE